MPQDPSQSASRQPIPAWAVGLTRILDDGLTIPGTRIGIGLDAIVGFLLPTIGDAATGLCSLALLVLGFQMRVPRVVLLRMVLNIALDTLLGSVPLVGDVFDLFWRSNRRNLQLLQAYDRDLFWRSNRRNLQLLQAYDRDPDRRPELADYLVVGLGIALVVAAVVLPVLLGVALLHFLWHAL